jgi:hypothetical protein
LRTPVRGKANILAAAYEGEASFASDCTHSLILSHSFQITVQPIMHVAVIGGGPSGLVTLKYLTTAHEFFPGLETIEAKLFEAEDSIGGTFKYRAYENAEVRSHILLSFQQNSTG